jgi:hypothetical protein
MSEVQALRLTNRRPEVSLRLPDGSGGYVTLQPGETKLVYGEYEYFKRMPRQGITGLTVKAEPGVKVPASAKAHMDIHLCKITNHKKIPVRLATGVDHTYVQLAPGEAKECVARESIVKQVEGISCRRLEGPKPEEERVVKVKTRKSAKAEAAPKPVKSVTESEAEQVRAAGATGKLEDLRESCRMPATKKEWMARSRNLGWHDIRGIAKAYGLRTKSREETRKKIAEIAYPGE